MTTTTTISTPTKGKDGKTDAKFPLIANATPLAYPTDWHVQMCSQLRTAPATWILPSDFRILLAEHFNSDVDSTDAFLDERNNLVIFWNEDWTDDYLKWVIAHECFHSTQFFDKGNADGKRWEGLEDHEMMKQWEREATNFANKALGKRLHKDFKPYKSMETPQDGKTATVAANRNKQKTAKPKKKAGVTQSRVRRTARPDAGPARAQER